jgi:hypothetical protein
VHEAGDNTAVLSILLVTFPFFVLVLCGYIAARRAMLPQVAIPGLNTFVLYFALPCMLYRFGATTPIAQLLDGSLIRASAGTTLLSGRWWRPFPTPVSWAFPCWWRCWAPKQPARRLFRSRWT